MSSGTLRIDKWLWYARFFKSRTLAGKLCNSGKLHLNGQPITKSHATLAVGDILNFAKERENRYIKVIALGHRRGPASEAATLYEDLSPPEPKAVKDDNNIRPSGSRDSGAGRPTKADRRALDRLRNIDPDDH